MENTKRLNCDVPSSVYKSFMIHAIEKNSSITALTNQLIADFLAGNMALPSLHVPRKLRNEDSRRLNCDVPTNFYKQLKLTATAEDTTISAIVNGFILFSLAQDKAPEKKSEQASQAIISGPAEKPEPRTGTENNTDFLSPLLSDISNTELERLVWKLPLYVVGEACDVSDQTIRRECIYRGIKLPPKGYIVSDRPKGTPDEDLIYRRNRWKAITAEELQLLLDLNTATTVGKMFGISSSAVKKKANQLCLQTKPRGYWQQVSASHPSDQANQRAHF